MVLSSVGSVGALVVDVPNGAVGGSRESERSLLEMPLVGEVRRDVGGIVGVVVAGWCSIFVHFLNSVGRSVLSGESGVDVGAEGLLESVHAGVACLWVAVVSLVDEDVGGIVGVVGVADGTSELSSVGSRVAVGMLAVGDVGGRFASAGANGSVVGVVGFVGDFGGADGVSVFVGFKDCWSIKECWSVLVLAHGRQVWPM